MDYTMIVRDAESGAEAKLHSEGCCERSRQAMLNDDVGQQWLHATEQRLAPTGGQQASARRVEVAQEGQDEEMTEAAASSAWRVDVSSSRGSEKVGAPGGRRWASARWQ